MVAKSLEELQYELLSAPHYHAHNKRLISARNTNAPTCDTTIEEKVLFPSYSTDIGPISTDNILAVLRDQLCNNTACNAPIGIKSGAMVVAKDDEYSKCEISIGLTDGVEAYAYRQGSPEGHAKDECTQSFNSMIQIIQGQVKECYLVGSQQNHVYQAGFRALNAHNASALHISQGKIIQDTLASDTKVPESNSTSQYHDSVFNEKSSPDSKTPIYVGSVIGVIALIVITVTSVCCYRKKKAKKNKRRQRSGSQGKKKRATNMSSTLVGSESGRSWRAAEQV
ncbi:uncharacterized protein MYCFIDRAFT_210647 [Pseudocercospora fijiensis CIRAD86]|uniref:Uncharacterized protein n=1 Tax=Pseudocercospora fijiensis (strain CIRAD86) TaxID=383855 RepID=M3AQP6_PSEFD|nr:uncharacterized protein MYCFIDRAFT_210647 [Pseudocercospora fijiensis CIRAD86]EME86941.1 hypothetical protein MYCFIDRAFT_210647 [Pseudocercospora fijiensis CIRAD86]